MIVFLVWSTTALASDGFKFYGDFFIHKNIPKTAFKLTGIGLKDHQYFDEMVASEEINFLVLASPGGRVFAGLQIAERVHSNNIATYVPGKISGNNLSCASACSFIFFAGRKRYAKGKIGLHRFATDSAYFQDVLNRSQPEEVIEQFILRQGGDQMLTTKIIMALKAYGMPNNLIEKTFYTDAKDIAWIDGSSLTQVNYLGKLQTTKFEEIDDFLRNSICYSSVRPIGYKGSLSSTCNNFPNSEQKKEGGISISEPEVILLSLSNCLEPRDKPFAQKHFKDIELELNKGRQVQLKTTKSTILMESKPASFIGTAAINIKGYTKQMTFEIFAEKSNFWLSLSTEDRKRVCSYSRL